MFIGFVCAIALLGGRSAAIYKELFSILTYHAGRLNMSFRPAKLSSDFEPALIKAVADVVSSIIYFLFE